MQDILEKRQYPLASRDATGNLRVAAAVGPFDFERAMLLDTKGVDALVVDCAHGHNLKVVKAVGEMNLKEVLASATMVAAAPAAAPAEEKKGKGKKGGDEAKEEKKEEKVEEPVGLDALFG